MSNQIDRPSPKTPALTGCFNFRDIGGLTGHDDRKVRHGLAFRSGSLSRATPADIEEFSRLGIRAVCDFRSGPEHEANPNQWIEKTDIEYWRWDASVSVGDSLALLRECSASEDLTRLRMQEVFRQIPYEQAVSFRELFTRLAAGKTPIVFHCAAGKDRTGVAAALLLSILGVEKEDIFRDFERTNHFFDRIRTGFLSDPRHTEITSGNNEAWVPMLKAYPEYLEAMFKALVHNHGSVPDFVQEIIGIDRDAQEQIRQHLLD